MEVAGLFVDDLPAAGRRPENREVVVIGEPLDGLRFPLVGVQVELAVPVRKEVDRVANPHRVDVVRPVRRLRHHLDGFRRRCVEPNHRMRAAAVVLPLGEGVVQRVVRDAPAVRRKGAAERVRQLDLRRKAPLHRHGEHLRVAAAEHRTRGGEHDGGAVGCEPLNDVASGVVGQPRRHAACDRDDVDVTVPFVLSGEGDQRAVGRERRIADTLAARQAADVLPVGSGHPQIAGVDKGDVRLADRRLAQQPGIRGVDGPGRNHAGEREKDGDHDEAARAVHLHSSPFPTGRFAPR